MHTRPQAVRTTGYLNSDRLREPARLRTWPHHLVPDQPSGKISYTSFFIRFPSFSGRPTNDHISCFTEIPLTITVPSFTPTDHADMSKKLSATEMRKMVAEWSEKPCAGNKRKPAPSAGSDGSPRPSKITSSSRPGKKMILTQKENESHFS